MNTFIKKQRQNRYLNFKKMRILLAIILISVSGASVFCISCASPQKIEKIKSNSKCLEYKENLSWEVVRQVLGDADEYPEQIEIGKNTRIYHNVDVVFYVESEKTVSSEGEITYPEVIKKAEIFRQK